MAGMVYPVSQTSSKPFGAWGPERTSEVELPLFYWVERGGHRLEELWGELHDGRAWRNRPEALNEAKLSLAAFGARAGVQSRSWTHRAACALVVSPRCIIPIPSHLPAGSFLLAIVTMKPVHQRLNLCARLIHL